MTKQEAQAAKAEAEANRQRLRDCRRPHLFEPHESHAGLVSRYRCTLCEGTASADEVTWYKEGLADAQRALAHPRQ